MYTLNNEHFLYENLFKIIFTLYDILTVRAYLFGLSNKDSCDSADLKTEQPFVLYLWWPGSWSPASCLTARLFQWLRLGVTHLWHSQKRPIFLPLPPLPAKINNRSIVQKQ